MPLLLCNPRTSHLTLNIQDTKHGFQERIKVNRPQSHASEPVFCSVWRDGQTESIELNSSNYRFAATKLEDNARGGRPSNGRNASATTASTSPSSSTYSSDLALQEFMDSPYRDAFLQLTQPDQGLETSQNGLHPQTLIFSVPGEHPLPIPTIQHPHLAMAQVENLNIEVSGYPGFRAPAYHNQGMPVNTQVPMVPHNLK